MITTFTPTSLVSYVTMRMIVNGMTLPVAQMASDFIILRDTPPDIAPCDAEIIMEVDGEPTHYLVHLPAGLAAEKRRTPIAPAE